MLIKYIRSDIMNYIIVYDEDRIKGFEDLDEVQRFKDELIQLQIEDYCDDYDIDIEDLSPERLNQIVFACGHENGDTKTYDINDLTYLIKESKIDSDDKYELNKLMKLNYINGYVSEYYMLDEILESAQEIDTDF